MKRTVMASLCAFVVVGSQGQSVWYPGGTMRPPVEPAEQVLKRTGTIVGSNEYSGWKSTSKASTSNAFLAAQMATAAGRIEFEIERYSVSEKRLVYRSAKGLIRDPVRWDGKAWISIAEQTPDDWIEIQDGKVISVTREGLIVDCGRTSDQDVFVVVHPDQDAMVDGNSVRGVFQITGKKFEYTAASGGKRTLAVVDYGPVPEPRLGLEMITSERRNRASELRAHADVLRRQSEADKAAERKAAEDRISRFRAEQEAKKSAQ